jgi:hypothetical protein
MTQPLLLAMPDSDIAPVTDQAMFNLCSCEMGDISEDSFDLEARKRGWLVASGRGKGRDFDSIIKRPHLIRPVSIQTKLAHLDKNRGSYRVKCSTKSSYTETAFDVLAVHLADCSQFVFFLRSELGDRGGFRYMPINLRKRKEWVSAVSYRQPGNWNLLDEVAESLTANRETGFTPTTADVPPLPIQMSTYL